MAAVQQLASEDAREEGSIHLDEARQVPVDRLVQRRLHDRMGTTEGEDAEATEEVEVAAARLVEEVGALTALVEAVEADRAQHADQLRVDVARVEAEVLAPVRAEHLVQLESHRLPPS